MSHGILVQNPFLIHIENKKKGFLTKVSKFVNLYIEIIIRLYCIENAKTNLFTKNIGILAFDDVFYDLKEKK